MEGWTDIMYYVQDAHSFWDWIYFVLLIVVSIKQFQKNINKWFRRCCDTPMLKSKHEYEWETLRFICRCLWSTRPALESYLIQRVFHPQWRVTCWIVPKSEQWCSSLFYKAIAKQSLNSNIKLNIEADAFQRLHKNFSVIWLCLSVYTRTNIYALSSQLGRQNARKSFSISVKVFFCCKANVNKSMRFEYWLCGGVGNHQIL